MLRLMLNVAVITVLCDILNAKYSKYFIQIDILENGVGSNIRLMCFYKC